MKTLNELEAGDDVLVKSEMNERLAKVERVTKTQIIVGSDRFRKKDGYMVGEISFCLTRVYPATEEDSERIKLKERAVRIKKSLNGLKNIRLLIRIGDAFPELESEDEKR